MAELDTSSTSELIVIMERYASSYIGSKAMLVAEGIKPKSWPNGFDYLDWEDDSYSYRVRRVRPEGAKGARREFAEVDWWRVWWEPLNRPDYAELRIVEKRREFPGEFRSQKLEHARGIRKR